MTLIVIKFFSSFPKYFFIANTWHGVPEKSTFLPFFKSSFISLYTFDTSLCEYLDPCIFSISFKLFILMCFTLKLSIVAP